MLGFSRLRRPRNEDAQRGQTIVLIALGMLTMIGFVGLATDTGVAIAAYRNLSRMTDAAALAAASALSGSSVGDTTKMTRATEQRFAATNAATARAGWPAHDTAEGSIAWFRSLQSPAR